MIEVLGLNESSWLKSEIHKLSFRKLFILLLWDEVNVFEHNYETTFTHWN